MHPLFKRLFDRSPSRETDMFSAWLRKSTRDLTIRVARYLSRKDQRLTLRAKKVILACFCLTVAFYGGMLIYRAFAGDAPDAGQYLRLPTITRPVLGRLPDSLALRLIHREAALTDSLHHP